MLISYINYFSKKKHVDLFASNTIFHFFENSKIFQKHPGKFYTPLIILIILIIKLFLPNSKLTTTTNFLLFYIHTSQKRY